PPAPANSSARPDQIRSAVSTAIKWRSLGGLRFIDGEAYKPLLLREDRSQSAIKAPRQEDEPRIREQLKEPIPQLMLTVSAQTFVLRAIALGPPGGFAD